jgi:hypothetical protein
MPIRFFNSVMFALCFSCAFLCGFGAKNVFWALDFRGAGEGELTSQYVLISAVPAAPASYLFPSTKNARKRVGLCFLLIRASQLGAHFVFWRFSQPHFGCISENSILHIRTHCLCLA